MFWFGLIAHVVWLCVLMDPVMKMKKSLND